MTDISFTSNEYSWSRLGTTPEVRPAVELAQTVQERALAVLRKHAEGVEEGDTALRIYVGGTDFPVYAAHNDFWWGNGKHRYAAPWGAVVRRNLFTDQYPLASLENHYVNAGVKDVYGISEEGNAPEIRYIMTEEGEFRAGFHVTGTGTHTFAFTFRSTHSSALRGFSLRSTGLGTELDDDIVLETPETWFRVERTITLSGPATIYVTPSEFNNVNAGDVIFIKQIVLEAGTDAGMHFDGFSEACEWEGTFGRSVSKYTPQWFVAPDMELVVPILDQESYSDGFVDVYLGMQQPVLPDVGDLWIKGGLLKRFDGMAWIVLHDDGVPAVEQDLHELIKGYRIEYAVNASETTPPVTGWSTDTPVRAPGTYIWFRTVITYNDGTTSTTSPALLTGNDGAPGEPGSPGIPGSPGEPGAPGEDGASLYTWLKYADTPTSGMSNFPDGKEYMGVAYNQTSPTESNDYGDYEWSKIRGDDGVPGPPGDDGQTLYTWIKYADDAQGGGMSDNPTGKEYIGLSYNQTTPTESSNPSHYTWALIKGADGQDGIPGEPGADGVTYYTWLKYADSPTTGMSDSPVGKDYMGIAVGKTSPTESTNYGDYTWSLVRGEPGEDGAQGIPGDPGADGQTTYTWVRYADDAQGNGISNLPDGKTYIGFAFNKTTPTESNTPGDYQWSRIQGEDGSQGVPGPPGDDGTTYYTWLKYADTPTTGMSDDPAGKDYIGLAYNKVTSTESSNYGDYTWSLIRGEDGSQGIPGPPGEDGTTYYTWVKYADDINGGGISDDPAGKSYIGFAYNKTTATESSNPGDYTWAKIQGDPGAPGVGIVSIAPYFQRLTKGSSTPAKPTTNPPDSSWTPIEPDFQAGTELYRTELVVYSDGSFDYTTVTKVATYTGIDDAITMANGKNTVSYVTITRGSTIPSPPTTSGRRIGDVHRVRYSDNGEIAREWMVADSGGLVWQEVSFGDEILRSLDVGKLTAGSLNVAVDMSVGGTINVGSPVDGLARIEGGPEGGVRFYIPDVTEPVSELGKDLIARNSDGDITASMTGESGVSSAAVGEFATLMVGGQDVTERVTQSQSGLILMDDTQYTTKGPYTENTGYREIGFLAKANHAYEISSRLHLTATGGAGTYFAYLFEQHAPVGAALPPFLISTANSPTSDNQSLGSGIEGRFQLSYHHITGSTDENVRVLVSARGGGGRALTFNTNVFTVTDLGVADPRTNTGRYSLGGASGTTPDPTPPPQLYKEWYNFDWSQVYQQYGYATDPTLGAKLRVGRVGGNANYPFAALLGISSAARSAVMGASRINRIAIQLTNIGWQSGAIILGQATNTSKPTTFPTPTGLTSVGNQSRGSTVLWSMPSSWHSRFIAGTNRAITIGRLDSNGFNDRMLEFNSITAGTSVRARLYVEYEKG